MRRRLLGSMLAVATLAVLGFGLPLAFAVQALYRNESLLRLSTEASKAAAAIPGSFGIGADAPELPPPLAGIDVALYDRTGKRVLGVGPSHVDEVAGTALRSGAPQRRPDRLAVALPITREEVTVGVVRASTPRRAVVAQTLRAWALMAALAGVVLAAAGAIASRRSRTLAEPLARLAEDAAAIGGGGELERRPAQELPEVEAVRTALTEAASRLNGALARERALSGEVAHQLRTPLASLRLRLETDQQVPPQSSEQQLLVRDALADVERLERTIDDLLQLARDTRQIRTSHPLATLLRHTVSSWQERYRAAARELVVSSESSLPWIDASPAAVRQILDVLLDNALVHAAGPVHVSATRMGPGAVIEVRDEGSTVISQDLLARGQDLTSGAGGRIGVALAQRLAEAEGIRLVLADPGPGVRIHVVFPGRRPSRLHDEALSQ